MLKKLFSFALFLGALSLVTPALAQANPTATALSNLQLGAGFTYSRTDYGQKGDRGVTGYADYNLGVHWGAEAAYHYISIKTPNNVSENSFVVGPRFILRKHALNLYGKGLIGLGHIKIDNRFGRRHETDFLVGAGGGAEFLLSNHLTLRPIDVEYQRWSFDSGLTPVVLTFGAAYRFR